MKLPRGNRFQKGSATLELTIMVTAVVGVLLIFLGPNGFFTTALMETLDTAWLGEGIVASMESHLGGGNEDPDQSLAVAGGSGGSGKLQ